MVIEAEILVVWSGGSNQGWSASIETLQYQEFMETARYGHFVLFADVVIGSNREVKTQLSVMF